MKRFFIVSLVKDGLLGGGIVADAEAITYRTGKLTIPQEYRHLVIKYEDICKVTKGRFIILPTVTIKIQNGNEYKFVVFFSSKRFVNTLRKMGVNG